MHSPSGHALFVKTLTTILEWQTQIITLLYKYSRNVLQVRKSLNSYHTQYKFSTGLVSIISYLIRLTVALLSFLITFSKRAVAWAWNSSLERTREPKPEVVFMVSSFLGDLNNKCNGDKKFKPREWTNKEINSHADSNKYTIIDCYTTMNSVYMWRSIIGSLAIQHSPWVHGSWGYFFRLLVFWYTDMPGRQPCIYLSNYKRKWKSYELVKRPSSAYVDMQFHLLAFSTHVLDDPTLWHFYITMGIIVVNEDWLVVTKGTQRHHVVSGVILNVCHRMLKIQLRKHGHLITWTNKTD